MKIYTAEMVRELTKEWFNSDSEKSKRAWRKLLRDIKK
jgi:hypothetical protein